MNLFEDIQFSWEKPIEQEMLEWLMSMASQMETVAASHDSKSIREGAEHYAKAYKTAGEHLLKEIKLRKRIKK